MAPWYAVHIYAFALAIFMITFIALEKRNDRKKEKEREELKKNSKVQS